MEENERTLVESVARELEKRSRIAPPLSAEQKRIVEEGLLRSDFLAQFLLDSYGREKAAGDNRLRGTWLTMVLSIEVTLRPAGRAILRGLGCTVEIQWLRGKDKVNYLKSVHVDFDTENAPLPDWQVFFTAFELHATTDPEEKGFTSVPRKRPAPGKPLDPDFYRRLLASYDKLVREGWNAPAQEIARRMGENPSTVKSWLHRGRKYLKEGES